MYWTDREVCSRAQPFELGLWATAVSPSRAEQGRSGTQHWDGELFVPINPAPCPPSRSSPPFPAPASLPCLHGCDEILCLHLLVTLQIVRRVSAMWQDLVFCIFLFQEHSSIWAPATAHSDPTVDKSPKHLKSEHTPIVLTTLQFPSIALRCRLPFWAVGLLREKSDTLITAFIWRGQRF